MLDSKNIFIAVSAHARNVTWRRESPDTEWQYVGDSRELDREVLQARIDRALVSDALFLVIDRHRSRSIARSSAAEEVIRELRDFDVLLCDYTFEHFLQFDRIGVSREGVRRSPKI